MSTERTRGTRHVTSLLLEDALFTVFAYVLLALYAKELISFFWMQAALIVYVIRVFNLRHERAHLPLRAERPWLFAVSNLLEVYHLPIQEPFSEKRMKHLMHHKAHSSAKDIGVAENPHALLDTRFLEAFFVSAFYHEVMFVMDLRAGRFTKLRAAMIAVATLAIALTVSLVGWKAFLLFVLAYRVASFIAWFTFSYVLHTGPFYEKEIGPLLPGSFKKVTEWILGSGTVTAIFYHRHHHTRPSIYFRF